MLGNRGTAVVTFVVLLIAIVMIKPKFLINSKTGAWKEFGFGEGKSCFNLFTVSVILAIFAYLISFLVLQ